MSHSVKPPFSPISTSKKIILSLLLVASVSCTKESLDTRVLQPGTKCDIYSGVFAAKDKQPALPVTVMDVYRTASSGLTYYDVKDANGVIWQIPDNDLQVVQ